jgi:hypothetical protein
MVETDGREISRDEFDDAMQKPNAGLKDAMGSRI